MTLVLTELTPFGVVMAADSAVTFTNQNTGHGFAVPNAARKLQTIHFLNAGVSCWGMGSLAGKRTDEWLANFILQNAHVRNVGSFATELANSLRAIIGPSPDGRSRIGFHLAGFENHNEQLTPSFYHVHDGPSTTLQGRGTAVDPCQVNANHDMPPAEYLKLVANGHGGWITRNGAYQTFQIRTVSDLYRMSNLVPGIGGPISYLTISPGGIQDEGVSYH